MMRLLINASNLHVGGGVQVAASFLSELVDILNASNLLEEARISVVCSTSVYYNLDKEFSFCSFDKFNVIDVFGVKKTACKEKYFNGYDVVFTVFGPNYHNNDAAFNIVGFAQAWIAYPNNPVFHNFNFFRRILNRVKYEVQWLYFNKADKLIVELPHVKMALTENRKVDIDKISVVENCVSGFFNNKPETWAGISLPFNKSDHVLTFGFLGRGYYHKNLKILAKVSHILENDLNLTHRFLFTLTDDEMADLEFNDLPNFHSIGPINSNQCPSFYREIDALIFPSLLECFSATPLEGMLMKVPVFASNLPFVKDVCEDHVFYFDPYDAQNIARVIFDNLTLNQELTSVLVNAYHFALSKPSAKDRAKKYLNCISKLKVNNV
ncbi:glycosyltransferase family 4 protein [Vibrio sp. 10N.286.48.C11]|uniref:glycosyltransferase family 4 protein n=1 Tax=Vibrio sp. 10N.286.48.C11 TaxID=3229698 RepID=UPI00354B95B5